MTDARPRREFVTQEPLEREGILYARLAPGPHDNLVYLVADPETRKGAVIDPAFEVDRILEVARRWDVTITEALFTHHHWDHTEGAAAIHDNTGCALRIHEGDAGPLREKGLEISPHTGHCMLYLGDTHITCHHTPGHTPGGTTYQVGKRLFTGDFLFVDTCGRTDFPGGSKRTIWESLQWFKDTFPDDHIICPGHDYGEHPEATIGQQRIANPALRHTKYERFADEWFLVAY